MSIVWLPVWCFIGLPEYVNESVSESVSVSYAHFFLFACFVLFYSDNIKS